MGSGRKGGAKSFRGGERKEEGSQGEDGERGRQKKRNWKQNGTKTHGPEKLLVARDFTAEEYSSVEVDPPDLGTQLSLYSY